MESPKSKVGEFYQIDQSDLHQIVDFGSATRPVLIALGHTALLQFRHHNDGRAALFPDHSPEIAQRLRQRALCRNIRISSAITVDEICVDIVRSGQAFDRVQFDSSVVESDDIRKTIFFVKLWR